VARAIRKLTDVAVRSAKNAGRYSDGGGLYLNVGPGGSKSWLFLWTPAGGKRREMGLGPYPAVSLAAAREKAEACRRLAAEGRDPIAERDRLTAQSFRQAAEACVAALEPSWRNPKHRDQWRMTLSIQRDASRHLMDSGYCQPLRDRPVAEVTTSDVLAVLQPIWSKKPETAVRLRGRIERVLDFAAVQGWRSGENPARWRGHLQNALAPRLKAAQSHHAAMPYADLPAFVGRLQALPGMSAAALEFLILTAARSGEVRGMIWPEIDFATKIWTVPGSRMKAGRTHRVPLSNRAVEILVDLEQKQSSEFVFPGEKRGAPLSIMALTMLMRRMKVGHLTPHGFRSSFRDWVGDETEFPREIAEAALAHAVGDEVERSYRRSDALERRRALMLAWEAFLCTTVGEQ
jgi:integrase